MSWDCGLVAFEKAKEGNMSLEYRVGIIGAGMMACGYDTPQSDNVLSHAHAIAVSDGFILAGIYDIDKSKAIYSAKRWNTKAYSSLEELKVDCDLICCAVSDNAHYEVLSSFFEAGSIKAVLCEKPISTDVQDAIQIVEHFKKKNIPVIVNYSRRFMSGFRTLKKQVSDYGKLIIGNCFYGKGMIHNCSHMINILDYLIDITDYQTISIYSKVFDYNDDDPSIGFCLDNGESKVYFHVIPCDVTTDFRFELCFEKGKIVYDDAEERIIYYKVMNSEKYNGYTNYRYLKFDDASRNMALPMLYSDIHGLLCDATENYSDGESAVKTLLKCFEIQKEARKGK